VLIDAVFVSAAQRNKTAEFVQNNYGKYVVVGVVCKKMKIIVIVELI
jgi:hypothetical protein